MKKRIVISFLSLLMICISICSHAQLLSTTPAFLQDNSTVTISFDASKGNKALMNAANTADVYIHAGVITNLSQGPGDWKYSKFTWASLTAAAKATYAGNNIYTYSIPNVRTFFAVPAAETILKVVLVFRNGAGTIVGKNDDGSDMFVPVYSATQAAAKFTTPVFNPYYYPAPSTMVYTTGQSFAVGGISKSAANLTITHNGNTIASAANALSVNGTVNITAAGNQVVKIIPNGSTAAADSFSFYVAAPVQVLPLPAGMQDGINYNSGNTSATLVLHAPGKNKVLVIGDFNNWTLAVSYQMNKTPDGQKFWITVNGLTPGTEYSFQYVVDDAIKIADPYSEKILDPWNDSYINDVANFTVYPNLKPYPAGKTTSYVSVIQTAKPAYTWTSTSTYARPAQNKLLVYELHVRDFVATHSWKTLKDTLNYLQKLGINAIEVMPFNEFDGNDSWGYNPNFYNAPDKYYGTDADLKAFIDECHKRNIAVIQDIVFNHAWGSCPLVQLYYDAANNRPAANNPWFNQTAPHPFGFGNDFNFSSSATRYFFQRILEYWMTEYKVDGFRFDLSKGFTNKNTGSDVAAWGAYDAERVANIKWLADVIWNKTTNGYVILEHLGEWGEENEYMNYKQGMMPWHRLDIKYNEATLGFGGCNQDISEVYYKHNNNFSRPLRMGNLESHDEERLMYKNNNYGKTVAGYDVKNIATGLSRMQAAAAFHLLMPGPKMIWQFTELGYDYSINACSNGVPGTGDECRTARKPIKWEYFQNADRKRLYNVMSAMMKLKNKYGNVFASDLAAGYDLGCNTYKYYQFSTAEMNVTVVGNFDVVAQTKVINFQKTGTWTEYITGNTSNFGATAQSITLQPGEFKIYLDKNVTMSNIDVPVTVKNFSVYFKKPAAWAAAKIHFWSVVPTGAVAETVWPGNNMVQVCGDWYRWDFTNIASVNLLFNDGGTNKTIDLSASGTAYYDNGWLATAPVINANPAAIFSLSATTGTAPLSITANAATSTSCGGITNYSWNFGNGTTATGATASVTYTTTGTYTVKLVVTDNQNKKDSSTKQVVVSTQPTGGFTVYLKKPADWANTVKIHYWSVLPAGSLAATTWPGLAMTADCNGWFKYTFPSSVTSTNVIFNDGAGKQTADLLNVNTTRYYDNGWLATNPAICNTLPVVTISPASTTFTDSIKVTLSVTDDKTGSIIYYTTNGTAATTASTVYTIPFWVKATTTVNATAKDSDGAMAATPVTATYTKSSPSGNITVYFENTGAWAQPKVYCWSAVPATYTCAAWPGSNMTKVANCGNWWSYTFTGVTSTNLIFNSGAGTQSADLNRAATGIYNYSWTSKAWLNGAPTCTGARFVTSQTKADIHHTSDIINGSFVPNPVVSTNAILKIESATFGEAEIKIMDSKGAVVQVMKKVKLVQGVNLVPVNMQVAGKGMFVAVVQAGNAFLPVKFMMVR